MPEDYGWTRVWRRLAPGEGYDADDQPLAGLRDVPCLALLGAPGMGKSREAAAAAAACRARDEATDLVLAGRRADVARTLADLLVGDAGQAWARDGAVWNIFVDGVDEIAGAAGAFAPILDSFLNQLAAGGGDLALVRLRLFCRTIEWTEALDQTLLAHWPERQIQKRQLVELDVANIRQALGQLARDDDETDRFFAALEPQTFALASRPVSFQMLADVFLSTGQVQGRQVDLYQQALRSFLSRSSPPGADAAARLTLAARIAAATAFSTKSAVWIGADGPCPSTALRLSEIGGGYEPAPPSSFRVRDADLFDILRSPLFVLVAPDTYAWAHKSFEEYLAARYLVEHGLTPSDLFNFLAAPAPDGEAAIPGPLREIAAWAAALSPPFFRQLIETEPDVLLQSDVAAALPEERKALVDALLERIEHGELTEIYFGLLPLFGKLAHAALSEQLAAFLRDPTNTDRGKRAAIDIAEANGLKDLSDLLASLATSPETPILLRKDAAYAVYRFEDAAARASLAPLLKTDLSDDVDDELRGAILLGAWPEYLSVSDLLAALTPSRRPSLIGAYASFLYGLELGEFSAEDALEALRWLGAKQPDLTGDRIDVTARGAYAKIFWAAAAQTTSPEVRDALAELVVEAFADLSNWLFDDYQEPARAWPGSPEARVDLVRRIVSLARRTSPGAASIQHLLPGLIVVDDLGAYLSALASETDDDLIQVYAGIIVGLCRHQPIDTLTAVWDAAAAAPALEAALRGEYFVEVPSAWADMLRTGAERSRIAAERRLQRETGASEAGEGVSQALAQAETDPRAWWRLNLQMFVDNAGRYQADFEFRGNLKTTPGWLRLSLPDRERVVDTAVDYLTTAAPLSLSWLGTNTTHRPSAAAYRALRLVREERPAAFEALEPRVWTTWAHAAVSFFDNEHAEAATAQAAIVHRAYAVAPDAVGRTLARLALGPKSQGISARVLELLAPTFDARLGALVERLNRRENLKTDHRGDLWAFLVRQRYPPALDALRDRLARVDATEEGVAANEASRDALADATAQLLTAGDAATWRQVVELRRRAPALAGDIWGRFAASVGFQRSDELDNVPEDLLGRAYLDLALLFPEPPPHDGEARIMTTIDHAEQLRHAVLARLVNLGTAAALTALTDIADARPDQEWLQGRVREARRNYQTAARRLYRPDQVIAVIAALNPVAPPAVSIEAPFVEPAKTRDPGDVPDDPTGPSAAAMAARGADTAAPLKILAVATEWRSGHGGVSTLNRELCVALAALGHDVRCLVIAAAEDERSAALADRVTLIASPTSPGIEPDDRLLLIRPKDLGGWIPDFVLGHDHVTGAAALVTAGDLAVPYVHFVHTVPGESEGLRGGTDLLKGDDKRERQLLVGRRAALVVGIGPKIHGAILGALPREVATHEMMPGLNVALLRHKPDLSRLGTLYCLLSGRMGDAQLKGVPLACDAIEKVIGDHKWLEMQPWLVLRGFDREGADRQLEAVVRRGQHRFLQLRAYTDDADSLRRDIAGASLVIMPSASEGFGLAGYEAIAAGVPVIVSDNSGLAHYLGRLGRTGLIDSATAQACVAAVRAPKLCAREWADRMAMILQDRASAFERAEALRLALAPILTWEKAAGDFVAAVRGALGAATTPRALAGLATP